MRSTDITAVYALKICNQFVLNTSCFRESHTSKFKFCNNYSNISCKKTLIKLDFKNRLYLYQNLNKNECSPTWSVFVIRRFLSASNGGFCNWSWVEETYFMTLVKFWQLVNSNIPMLRSFSTLWASWGSKRVKFWPILGGNNDISHGKLWGGLYENFMKNFMGK